MRRRSALGLTLFLMLLAITSFSIFDGQVKASGTIYIRADGSIDPPTAPILNVGSVSYNLTEDISDSIVIEKDNIVVDGGYHVIQGPGSGFGVDLSYRVNVTIKNMEIKGFSYGVHLFLSSSISIRGNNIGSNVEAGVYDTGSPGNHITENNITYNGMGIRILQARYNNVSLNNVEANNNAGIELSGSWENHIWGNNVANNGIGINLAVLSNNNSVFHNNFLGNSIQVHYDPVHTPLSHLLKNTWDDGYPCGGNYWSNYTGVDHFNGSNQNLTGSDGRSDTPYVINENNIDRYPLMSPWTLQAALDMTKPLANAGIDQTVNVGMSVAFDSGSSTDDIGIVSYEWAFGDGITGTGEAIAHTYANPGTYTVTLTVEDAAGNTATDTMTVTVLSSVPLSLMWIAGAALGTIGIALAAILFLRKRR